MMMRTRSQPVLPRRIRGVSLMEVLVALVVLSLGGLMAAAMQGTSYRANHDAQQRLIATFLVNEIIEKMRANGAGVSGYAGDPLTGHTISTEPSPNCTVNARCMPAEMALHDRWQWEQSIAGASIQNATDSVGGLVNPTGCIYEAAGQVRVVLSWAGVDELSDAATITDGDADCGQAGPTRRQLAVTTYVR